MSLRNYLMDRKNGENRYKMFLNKLSKLIECGLISYTTPETDKKGKTARTAVRGEALVGDGITWIDLNYVIQPQFIHYKVFAIVLALPSTISSTRVTGSTNIDSGIFNNAVGRMELKIPTIGDDSRAIVDESFLKLNEINTFEVKYDGSFKTLTVNGEKNEKAATGDFTFAGENLTIFSQLGVGVTSFCTIVGFELYHENGITYTLDIPVRQTDGKMQLINSGEPIIVQQFLPPAIPTVNSYQESLQDELGVTFAKALGKNLVNYENPTHTDSAYNTDGTLASNAAFNAFDVYVEGGETYHKNASFGGNYVFLDKDKVYISGGNASILNPPTNAQYIGVSILKSSETTAQLELGSVATTYEAWQGYYLDSLLTIPFEDGSPITNNNGYTIDGRITAEFPKNIKKNMVVCDVAGTPTGLEFGSGGYIKLDQPYDGITETDLQRILTEIDGTPKILEFDTLENITGFQLIVSENKQKIYFYAEPLDVNSKCFEKALKAAGLVEVLQTTETTGIENTYTTEDSGLELVYVYKEFVTEG